LNLLKAAFVLSLFMLSLAALIVVFSIFAPTADRHDNILPLLYFFA